MQSDDVPYVPEDVTPFVLDRRHWPRTDSMAAEIVVLAGSDSASASALDESLGGIGISIDQPLATEIGDQVQLLIDGNCFPATVKFVQPQEDGKFRIGLEWPTIGRPVPKPPSE